MDKKTTLGEILRGWQSKACLLSAYNKLNGDTIDSIDQITKLTFEQNTSNDIDSLIELCEAYYVEKERFKRIDRIEKFREAFIGHFTAPITIPIEEKQIVPHGFFIDPKTLNDGLVIFCDNGRTNDAMVFAMQIAEREASQIRLKEAINEPIIIDNPLQEPIYCFEERKGKWYDQFDKKRGKKRRRY